MAAYPGYAGRGVGAVDAEAELWVAQAYKYGAQWVFRSGGDGFKAVFTFFLYAERDVPSGIEHFRTDFVFAQVGLGQCFAYGYRISFGQFPVGKEEKPLLRDVDDDVLAG